MNPAPGKLAPAEQSRRMSRAAVASLAMGLLSAGLSVLAAVPALLLGLYAVRAINASGGRLHGARLAVAGMALGALATLATVVGVAAIVVLRLQTERSVVECANNLRAIGVAVTLNHDGNRGTYPAGTVPAPDLVPSQRLAWTVAILPFLDADTPAARGRAGLADKVDRGKPWDAPPNAAVARTRLRRFLCSSAPDTEDGEGRGLNSYIGLAGIDPDAPELPRGNPRDGFFGYDRKITDTDLARGLSHIMIVAETDSNPGPWTAGGQPTVRGLDPEQDNYVGVSRPFGGLHRAGANVLWADVSVTMTSNGCAPQLFRSLTLLTALDGP
jgi:hypothetical protein